MDWPAPELITSARLLLEPLSVMHAAEMVEVLAPPSLYEYTGGEPPSLEQLRDRYARQAEGRSTDGTQRWLNWIVRRKDSHRAIGFVQATLEYNGSALVADVAWVISPQHQGQGYASEAAGAMLLWLRARDVRRFAAFINPAHHASVRVARHQGLHPTSAVVDGETRWES